MNSGGANIKRRRFPGYRKAILEALGHDEPARKRKGRNSLGIAHLLKRTFADFKPRSLTILRLRLHELVEAKMLVRNRQMYRVTAKGQTHQPALKKKIHKRRVATPRKPLQVKKAPRSAAAAAKKIKVAVKVAPKKNSAGRRLLGKTSSSSTSTPLSSHLSESPCSAESAPRVEWHYNGGPAGKMEPGLWQKYTPEAAAVVEKAYQDYLNNPGRCDVRSVQSGEFHYLVDFLNMRQTNVDHENHTQRDIRRVG